MAHHLHVHGGEWYKSLQDNHIMASGKLLS